MICIHRMFADFEVKGRTKFWDGAGAKFFGFNEAFLDFRYAEAQSAFHGGFAEI